MAMVGKFTPKSGAAFDVDNITDLSWGVSRDPHVNHELGHSNHNIDMVSIVRLKGLQKKGKNDAENEILNLSAALEEKAYFKGVVSFTPASSRTNTIEKIEWDQGHITSIRHFLRTDAIEEHIQIATTGLRVNDAEFKLVETV